MSLLSLSKKADYGLLMLATLAEKGKGEMVSVSDLVKERGMPRAFTAQIGKELVEAGILGSKEGRNGGYFLLYDPSEIEVRDVLEAVDGEVTPVACVVGERCTSETYCGQKSFMARLAVDMGEVLSSYSVADLIG